MGLQVELLRDGLNLLAELIILGLLRLDVLVLVLMGLFELVVLILVVLNLIIQGAPQTVVVISKLDILVRHVFYFCLQESCVLFDTWEHIVLVVLDCLKIGLELIF